MRGVLFCAAVRFVLIVCHSWLGLTISPSSAMSCLAQGAAHVARAFRLRIPCIELWMALVSVFIGWVHGSDALLIARDITTVFF